MLLEFLTPPVIHTASLTGSLARQSSVRLCPSVPVIWLEHDP